MNRIERHIAANEIVVGEEKIHQGIVELINGEVVKYYSFYQEQPMTEWLGGIIYLKMDKNKKLKAYWNNIRIQ